MKGFSKLPLAVAVTSALVLSGCFGGGGGGGGGGGSSSGTPATATTLEGTVVKGIVLGGLVEAYELGSDTLLGTANTDTTDGSYTLTLSEDYAGGPLLIKVTTQDGTLMRCDLVVCQRDADGNPTVSFGEDYPLGDDFELQAAIPGSTDSSVSINVTPLTTFAAELVQQELDSSRGLDPVEVVHRENARVAARFQITGDLTSMKVVDLTDPQVLKEATAEQLSYSLTAAGVVAEAMSSAAGLSPEEAISAFRESFADSGIADAGAEGSGALSLAGVLKHSAELASAVEAKAVESGVELDQLSGVKGSLESASGKAQSGSTEPSQGEPPENAGSAGMQAVKEFVDQVRDLANTAALEENLQGFADEVEMVSQVAGDDIKASLSAAGMALRAIAEAEEARQNGVTETRFDFDGVVVNRSGAVYSVKQNILANGLSVAVDIAADVSYTNSVVDSETENESDTGSTGEYTTKGALDISIKVAGTAGTQVARVAIGDGSSIIGKGSIDVTGSWDDKWGVFTGMPDTDSSAGYIGEEEGTYVISALDSELIVQLERLAAADGVDPMQFEGRIGLDISNFKLVRESSDHYQWSWVSQGGSVTDNTVSDEQDKQDLQLGTLALSLSGKFSNSANELSASASLIADGVSFSQTCRDYHEYGYEHDGMTGNYDGYWDQDDGCSLAEGAKGNLQLALNFDLDLVGMSPVAVAISASNKGMDAVIGSVTFRSGGESLVIDYDGADTITARNHNDVVLVLNEKQVDGDDVLTGSITLQDKEYATVDMELGAPRIRYIDGSFDVM